MTKEQFFMELEECLDGEVSAYELSDSLSYYRQYFDEQIAAGKSEEEVIRELGSARLIARSIIDAHGNDNGAGTGSYGRDTDSYGSGRPEGASYGYEGREEPEEQDGIGSFLKKTGRTVVSIAVTIAVLVAIFFLVKALLPVALVIVAIVLIMRLIRG